MCNTCDYGHDVGGLHVIDWYLWLAALPLRPWPYIESPRTIHISPADWSRS